MRRFGFALLLVAFLGTAALGEEVVNRVVAAVGDDVITSMELEKGVQQLKDQLAAVGQMQDGEVPEAQIRKMALERMIDDKIFLAEVKRQDIGVAPEELDAFIERLRAQNNLTQEEFLAQLNRRGMTPEEYRENLKRDILKQKLISREVKSRIVISEDEVERFIANNNGQMGSLNQVVIRALFLRVGSDVTAEEKAAIRRRAVELRQQILEGADFAEMATQNSQGPGAEQGGKLGPISGDDLLPEMRKALDGLKPDAISEVVEVPGAYVFMKLVDNITTQDKPNEQLKEQVRQRLEREALEKRFQEWMKELRSKTYVQIVD